MAKMKSRVFGDIPGSPTGSVFVSRRALFDSGIHRQLQGGISGSGIDGSDSIVLSGGYEDDKDLGNVIVYTGQGGRDPKTGKQIADQTLTVGNLGLAIAQMQGLPVRVTRGAGHDSPYSPETGYRYDGLYRVEDHWREKGKAGFYVWRFRLVAWGDTLEESETGLEEPGPDKQPPRRTSTILRIVRDTKQSRRVKEIHDYRCQVCGLRLETAAGPYAEGAHIRGLGEPHNGPDNLSNLLCLCPNHHVLFDLRALSVAENMELLGFEGKLRVDPKHEISSDHLSYHRELYLNATDGSIVT